MTDLPPPYDPTIPYAVGSNAYIDVDGRAVIFTGDDPTLDRDLYLACAQSTLANFREIFSVMTAILFPHCPPEGPFEPMNVKKLLAEKMAEAKTDAALLNFPLPVAEAYAVWQRSCAHLRLCADLTPNPAERQELLDAIAESERRMEERIALHVRKYEERKRSA
jgi:hypothetical protein